MQQPRWPAWPPGWPREAARTSSSFCACIGTHSGRPHLRAPDGDHGQRSPSAGGDVHAPCAPDRHRGGPPASAVKKPRDAIPWMIPCAQRSVGIRPRGDERAFVKEPKFQRLVLAASTEWSVSSTSHIYHITIAISPEPRATSRPYLSSSSPAPRAGSGSRSSWSEPAYNSCVISVHSVVTNATSAWSPSNGTWFRVRLGAAHRQRLCASSTATPSPSSPGHELFRPRQDL